MKPFKFNSVKDFDAHIFASIPSFEELNYLAKSLCESFAQDETCVVDLGCSTGRFLKNLEKKDLVKYIGVDNCFVPFPNDEIEYMFGDVFDVISNLKEKTSVVVSLFTLQFLPTGKRMDVIGEISKLLVDGGVFICAEKTHLQNPSIESVVQNTLLEWKLNNFSKADVLDKSIGLKTVMHSRTQSQLVKELSLIGEPSVIWSWGQFVCYAVQKLEV